MGISTIRRNSNRFVSLLPVMIALAIEAVNDDLVLLNRSQMLSGERADGQVITPMYSPKYAVFKGFNVPNLKLTGDFQDDMILTVNENDQTFDITSFDPKTNDLIDRYTGKIFGIAPENRPRARYLVLNQLVILYNTRVLNG